MGRREVMDVADAIGVFGVGIEGLFVPIASNTSQGTGFYDAEAAVSRLATPLDYTRLQSLPPPTSWDRFHESVAKIIEELTAQGGLEELKAWAESVGLVAPNASGGIDFVFGLNLAAQYPGDFGTGAALAYSRYIQTQAQSYLDLVVKGLPAMLNAYACAVTIRFDATTLARMVAHHSLGQPNSELDMTIDALETWLAGNPPVVPVPGAPRVDCSGVLDALKGLRTAVDAFVAARDWLQGRTLPQIYDDFGYVALFLAELLRSRAIAHAIAGIVDPNDSAPLRAEKIGAMYGSLVGMIMWEIIEEVVTAGFGKVARIVRVVR